MQSSPILVTIYRTTGYNHVPQRFLTPRSLCVQYLPSVTALVLVFLGNHTVFKAAKS